MEFSQSLVGVIMAAGASSRFKGRVSKVLSELYGKPLISHVIDYLSSGGLKRIVIVTSPSLRALLEKVIPEHGERVELRVAVQERPLGTADAFKVGAMEALKEFGEVKGFIVTNGDVPLVRPSTVKRLIDMGEASDMVITAVELPDPSGYGRVLIEAEGVRIVEEAHLSPEQRAVKLVNAGLYYISSDLLPLLEEIKRSPKGEYYLTDLVEIAVNNLRKVEVMRAEDWREFIGINRRSDLARAFKLASVMKIEELWEGGVTILDPDTTYISLDTVIGEDTVIYPNTYIESSTIGKGSRIGPNVVIISSQVGDNVWVGPFSYIRPGTVIKDNAKVGSFVEVKNSQIGEGSKVPHLSYIGDAIIGRNVNVGAGTITCNYDGYRKHQTVIEDDAFIGSNTSLVAPVTVGARSVTGAGSVVTKDIPPEEVWVGNPARFLKTRGELESKLTSEKILR